jgi:hypothetical protein
MPVRDDLYLSRITASTMVALQSLQDALLKESIAALRRPTRFDSVDADVKWLECDRINVRFCVRFLTVLGLHVSI